MKPKYKLKSIGAAFYALDAGLKVVAVCPPVSAYTINSDIELIEFIGDKGYGAQLYIHPDSEEAYEKMVEDYWSNYDEDFFRMALINPNAAIRLMKKTTPPPETEKMGEHNDLGKIRDE